MIVYGDHPIEIAPAEIGAGLQRRLSRADETLDEARIRLVLAGQLEQAVEDAGLAWAAQCRALTDAAAADFVRLSSSTERSSRHLRAMHALLDGIACRAATHTEPLRVSTPEGFAWYALFPDAYAQAADAWSRHVAPGARVVAVGIRSIGTTLGATVAAVLKGRGFEIQRLTVRPHGHPFHRLTVLPPDLAPANHAIVVDEGPGQSGSSMASVAEALAARGFPRHALTFFPGHNHGPGGRASSAVCRWWMEVPRHCVSWSDLRLAGQSASHAMADLAQSLLGEPLRGSLHDVGAGRWRDQVGQLPMHLHGIAPYLEQPKLLARGCSGRGVLFKFAGFALAHAQPGEYLQTMADAQSAKLAELAEYRLTVAPLASAHGWIALPWIEGCRLRASDAAPALIELIGTYIRLASGTHLSRADCTSAHRRLRHILLCNTEELLGSRAALLAARASDRLESRITERELPAYGDGRLAPHEWIRSGTAILKMDAAGHNHDHTAIGLQPVWWDVAGASVEWDLDAGACDRIARLAGVHDAATAAYFRAAYAAFRAGIARMGADSSSSPSEARNFRFALRYYSDHLGRALLQLQERSASAVS